MRNGNAPTDGASSYLQYLPGVYQEDPFIARFLRIFEDVLAPIQGMANTLPERFDPRLTAQPMLDFLASWVGPVRPARLPEGRWRNLIRHAVVLHRWRGTKRGLRLALELATEQAVLIREYGPGLAIGQDASLGVNMVLEGSPAAHMDIMFIGPAAGVDTILASDIIRHYKPGHVSFTISSSPVAVSPVAADSG